jgi:lauroyl/myristoyl acyltransferase
LDKRRLRGRAFFWLVDTFMLGFYHVTSFLTLLPASVFYPMVRALAAFLFYARRAARRNLVENIANAMPEIAGDRRALERIGRGTYSSLLFAIPDLIYFKRHPLRFMRGLDVQGLEHLERADSEGKGVLGLLVHHGNAHKHVFMVLLEKPYMLVMSNPETASAVPRYTSKLVSTTFSLAEDSEELVIWVGPGFDTKKDVRDALVAGNRVGIPCDVDGKRVVKFFGRPGALADGIAHWAYDTGAPIVPITLLRTGRPYENTLVIAEPLSYELTGDRKTDVHTIMQAVASGVEDIVRLAPEQWMSWFGLRKWWGDAEEYAVEAAAEAEVALPVLSTARRPA